MGLLLAVGALVLGVACDDTVFGEPLPGTGPSTEPLGDEPWCQVLGVLESNCTACHSAGGAAGKLNLETDPHGALVGVTSPDYGVVLVVPGDVAGSLLAHKLRNTQGGEQGSSMPPGSALAEDDIVAVETWIAEGALSECGGSVPVDTGSTTYHPPGWAEPEVHGLAAKLQDETCVTCHGEDLAGGSVGVSCDTCHHDGWRTDCTFCHGGEETVGGAPPADIDGSGTDLSFSAHTVHVTQTIHGAWDCTTCHVKPVDVLSLGHVFLEDETPGAAEVDLSAGLSEQATYLGGASCSNLYCHGDGQGHNGAWSVAQGPVSCASCHADISSGRAGWEHMSGEHEDHLREGLVCADCHGGVVSTDQTILAPTKHVDGEPDLDLPGTLTYASGSCSGVCHGESHDDQDWR